MSTRSLLALLLLAAPAAAQTGRPIRIEAPFPRLADAGPGQHVRIGVDGAARAALDEAHRSDALVSLERFPLPGGREVDLLVRPLRVTEPGMTATVISETGERALAPTVQLFTGSAPGHSARVFLGISAEMLHGYVALDGELFYLSSGDRTDGQAWVTDASALEGVGGPETFCGFDLASASGVLEPGDDPVDPGAPSTQRALSGTIIQETKPFLDLDHEYRARFGSDQAAIDYAVLLVAATSEVYRRDLGITLIVPNGYVRLWTTTPPWGVTSTFDDLGKYGDWFKTKANAYQTVNRSVAHLLTSPVFGGVAQGVGIACVKTSSYAISSVNGSFPYPIQHTSGGNWDLLVFTHENGHIYGSGHTFNYVPPIDCQDGSGPDKGTIMSYCHLDFGTGGVGMRFHQRVQETILGTFKRASCPREITLIAGDYTADGVVDATDLAEFDAYTMQGFFSTGAQDTFDLNGDGVVDSTDRGAMLVLMNGPPPPASAVVRNGTGVNCSFCFVSHSEPILGETWHTVVGSHLGVINTSIHAATDPLVPGLMTSKGEVLIALTGLGGQTLYTNVVPTNGQWADHYIQIPFEPALIGARIYTQAAMWKPSGIELLNAIDVTIGVE